jgi:hypothetical protein
MIENTTSVCSAMGSRIAKYQLNLVLAANQLVGVPAPSDADNAEIAKVESAYKNNNAMELAARMSQPNTPPWITCTEGYWEIMFASSG